MYDLRVLVAVVVIPSSIFGHALLKLFTNFILQRFDDAVITFDDAVITFIGQEKYRMKVIIASSKRCNKVCEQLSSACPNIDQAIIVTCTHQTTQSHRLAGL